MFRKARWIDSNSARHPDAGLAGAPARRVRLRQSSVKREAAMRAI
jgi:hypothetical protein